MSRLRLVTLDATNTLFKVRGNVGEWYAKAAFNYGINTNSDKLERNFRESFHHFNTLYPNFGQSAGLSSEQWWNEVVKSSFIGYHIETLLLDQICKDLYNNFSKGICWDIFPDVVPALKELNHKGIKVGIISNFDKRLPKILEELNLKEFFSFIITSRETTFYKPSGEIFKHALSLTKLHSTQAAHIGDNLKMDYEAAKEAGMEAFLLLRQPTDAKINYLQENNVPPEKIISSLQTLSKQILKM